MRLMSCVVPTNLFELHLVVRRLLRGSRGENRTEPWLGHRFAAVADNEGILANPNGTTGGTQGSQPCGIQLLAGQGDLSARGRARRPEDGLSTQKSVARDRERFRKSTAALRAQILGPRCQEADGPSVPAAVATSILRDAFICPGKWGGLTWSRKHSSCPSLFRFSLARSSLPVAEGVPEACRCPGIPWTTPRA